jgi:hypothetical protein
MQYGNCLLGALFLMFSQRENKPKFILKYRTGTKIPHFMVKTKDQLHHYKVVKDILPWPFCYLIFKGTFQSVPVDEIENFNKYNRITMKGKTHG